MKKLNFVLRVNDTYVKDITLPYYAKLILNDSLSNLYPKKEDIYFDITIENDIYTVYVDLDQFYNGTNWACRYLKFRATFEWFDLNGKKTIFWDTRFEYIDSNVTGKKHFKNAS